MATVLEQTSARRSASQADPGFVYFMQCEDTTRIKIGHSRDPGRRLADLNSGSSTRVVLLATVPGGMEEEQAYHARFYEARVAHLTSREWFYPVPPLLDLIREHGGRPSGARCVPGVVEGRFGVTSRREVAADRLQRAARDVRLAWDDRQRALGEVSVLEALVHRLRVYRDPWDRAGYHHRGRGLFSARMIQDARRLVAWLDDGRPRLPELLPPPGTDA